MTKSELVQKLAEANPHLYQRDVEAIVTAIFQEIAAALARGDRVELRGFGAFSVKRRDARVGRNPRTGDSVQVSEKQIPSSKPASSCATRLIRATACPDRLPPRAAAEFQRRRGLAPGLRRFWTSGEICSKSGSAGATPVGSGGIDRLLTLEEANRIAAAPSKKPRSSTSRSAPPL